MREIQKAYLRFFGQFGIPAFIEGFVPPNCPEPPYITFTYSLAGAFENSLLGAMVWTRSDSFVPVINILAKIEEAVPAMGTRIEVPNGAVMLYRGSPFAEYMVLEDKGIKAAKVNIVARSHMV